MSFQRAGEGQCCTHLIEMLRVNLPEAAGGRLAEWAGPAQAGARAGVGPGPVSGRDVECRSWKRAAGGPAKAGRRDLARSRLRRSRRSRCRAGVHRLTGELSVVEVLLPLRLVPPAAAMVGKQGLINGRSLLESSTPKCVFFLHLDIFMSFFQH